MTRMDETKVARNNSTSVPRSFRTAEDVGPGDKIEWHHEGDRWIVQKKTEGGDE